MKKILICSLVCLAAIACSKQDTVQFCEGVDVEGKGVNCGKKFTTGDLTGVINRKKPFETELLEMKIYRVEKNTKIAEKTVHLKVERDGKNANSPLAFYNSGNYVVELMKDNDKIAEGTIEISDAL